MNTAEDSSHFGEMSSAAFLVYIAAILFYKPIFTQPLGKYGRLRRTYLMNHRPVLYNTMLLNGSLYRKSGYSKKFLEAHREEITLHKAAKAAFDEAGLQKLPKVKELDAEFAELLTKKKAAYPDYRKARNEMQELVRAQKNVERFFAEEKDTTEKTQTR